jgi:hypothetical protein
MTAVLRRTRRMSKSVAVLTPLVSLLFVPQAGCKEAAKTDLQYLLHYAGPECGAARARLQRLV